MVRTRRSGKGRGGIQSQGQLGANSELPQQCNVDDEIPSTSKKANSTSNRATTDEQDSDGGGAIPTERDEFQRVLRERKAERKMYAEQKRLEGLRSIEEKNSKVGVDPQDYFPKEVWDLVLNELTLQDKISLWEVHPMFRGLLKHHRIRDMLLPQILDHKKGILPKCLEKPNRNKTILELRRVSKSVRTAVDKWFEDDLLTMIKPATENAWQGYEFWFGSNREPVTLELCFIEEELQKILEIGKETKIFKRDLTVVGTNLLGLDEGIEERRRYFYLFVNNVTQVLERIGDQILRFEFYCESIERYGLSLAEVCTQLRIWLSHLPNLKVIDICFNTRPVHNNDMELNDDVTFLRSDSFPTLPHLKRVDLYASHEEYDNINLIAHVLFTANPHVKMINFDGPESLPKHFMSQRLVQLSLKPELCRFGKPSCPALFQEVRPIIGNPQWNLKMLDLYLSSEVLSINWLMKSINRLPTLEALYLNLGEISFSRRKMETLRLPNLVHFGVEFKKFEALKYDKNVHNFVSLHFLFHSSKLESLSWTQTLRNSFRSVCQRSRRYELDHPGEMLDFRAGFKDLKKSNLWDAFPRLQSIQLEYKWLGKREIFQKYPF